MEALSEPSGGDQNKGPVFSAFAITFCALACVSVLLRLYVRVRMIRAGGWDDVCICFALATSITTAGFNVTAVRAGFGRHGYYLSYAQLTRALKYTVLGQAVFFLSLTLGKISICLLLFRFIKQSHGRKKRIFLHFTIGLLTVTSAISLGQLFGQCQPVSRQWNPRAPGHCGDPAIYSNIAYCNGAVAAWVDFSLAVFPLTFIKDLQLSARKKVALAGLLSCGAFAGICAIVRTWLETRISFESDITWTLVGTGVWALVETNVAIIAACIPTLQPLYIAIVQKLSSTKESHASNTARYQARSRAVGFRRKGIFGKECNAHRADPEVGGPFEMTTYVSSSGQKDNGSEKELVSDAEMPGITAETVVRVSSTHIPT